MIWRRIELTKDRLSEKRRERTSGRKMRRKKKRMIELNLSPQHSRKNDLR
jgi:hypothetical protein